MDLKKWEDLHGEGPMDWDKYAFCEECKENCLVEEFVHDPRDIDGDLICTKCRDKILKEMGLEEDGTNYL